MAEKNKLLDNLKSVLRNEKVHARRFTVWLRERLWVRPALYCAGAVAAVFVSSLAAYLPFSDLVPELGQNLLSTLMGVLTASMLGVATFAVASMVSAFNSVGTNATPRAFSLIVSDDISKSALSTFIGAFIFGTVGTIALESSFFGKAQLFALFCITLLVYARVVWVLVGWIDAIARLGRMGTAISRVEQATRETLLVSAADPLMGAGMWQEDAKQHSPVFSSEVGYVQDTDMSQLNKIAEAEDMIVHICAQPGMFVGPGRAVAYLEGRPEVFNDAKIGAAFFVGKQRNFDSDPRFGFVVLSQIAARALSPGINDPGTAIDVLGSVTRLLMEWTVKRTNEQRRWETGDSERAYPRLRYKPVTVEDLLEDGFGSVAVYGAGQAEVMSHLQRYLQLLAAASDGGLYSAAEKFSQEAFERSRLQMNFQGDIDRIAREHEEVLNIVKQHRDRMK